MLVELHLIQNFAPANLNRDDTGAPKDCEFGGVRRARISSQCLKRAIRRSFASDRLIPEERRAVRTKRILRELTDRLAATGKDEVDTRRVVEAVLRGNGLKLDGDGLTEYLLFLGRDEIDAVAAVCADYWGDLIALAAPAPVAATEGGRTRRGADKRAGRAALPPTVASAVERLFGGSTAADLGLFGRMLADLPARNVEAACQVAHAISTHRVAVEFDFFSAVDELQRPDDKEGAGAGMLGTVEFNSACYYRYASVDIEQLTTNLGGDRELAAQTLDAFLRASFRAIPTGKQNSMAAQNWPAFALAEVRAAARCSLANAFAKPVTAGPSGDLIGGSIVALDEHWAALRTMYGAEDAVGAWAVALDPEGLGKLRKHALPSVAELIARTGAAAFPTGEAA